MMLTKNRVELLNDLEQEGVLLLHRDSKRLSTATRQIFLTGTWIIQIVDHQEVGIKQLNYRVAKAMIDAKYLKRCGLRPYQGKLYKLTTSAAAITEKQKKEKILIPHRRPVRTFSEDVQRIAAHYGCSITFDTVHKWYVLTRLDGTKLENPYIAYNQNGKPVMKLTDMQIDGWEEAIERQSEWKEPAQETEQGEAENM